MLKVEGLEGLQKNLKVAEKALNELDGDLGQVEFDPTDPESIDLAIKEMEQMIERRVGQFASNPFIGPIIEDMKTQYREAILEKAAEARIEDDEN